HAFLSFRPSQVAAACIAASRICLQISPSWTTVLHLLTGYSWDHLTQCIQLMLLAHDNDVKEANKSKSSPSPSHVSLQPQAHASPSLATSSLQRQQASSSQQLLLQAGAYPQHSPALSQLHMLAECQALGPVGSRDYLQPHHSSLLSASLPASSFPSFPSLASGLCGLPLQGPLSMQVGVGAEPRQRWVAASKPLVCGPGVQQRLPGIPPHVHCRLLRQVTPGEGGQTELGPSIVLRPLCLLLLQHGLCRGPRGTPAQPEAQTF
ncbi:hypothetical protein NFI96_027353, partial [Prochilodus magdalenae]